MANLDTAETFEDAVNEIIGGSDTGVDEQTQVEETTTVEGEDTTQLTSGEPQEVQTDKRPDGVVEGEEKTEDQFEFPKNWSEEHKALYSGLTAEQKAHLVSMSNGILSSHNKKYDSWNQEKKTFENDYNFGKQVRELFPEQVKTFLNSKGMDEVSALRMTMANLIMETQDPVSYAEQVLKRNGYDINKLAYEIVQSQQERDPYEVKLEQSITPFKQEIERLKSMISSHNTMGAENLLNRFKGKLKEDGTPKYEHFDAVEGLMAQMLPQGKSFMNTTEGELEEMYNNAVMAHPSLRESSIQAEVQRRLDEERRKMDAQKASNAGKVVSSGKSGVKTADSWEELRDSIINK